MVSKQETEKFELVTHVVFDVDGLLVNSERYYSLSLMETCKQFGADFTNDIKVAMMGTKPLEGAIICCDMLNISDKISPEQFVKLYEGIMTKHLKSINLMPGARRLIEHLSAHKIPIAIATGAAEAAFERKTGHIGDILRKPFAHHVFAGSDPEVVNGKPAPDVFLVAAKRFVPSPESMKKVLVFEDAPNGVKAAQAAGAQVVFVPDSEFGTNVNLLQTKPTLTINSLLDFRPEVFGLPAFAT